MGSDTVLNLVWVLLALASFACLAVVELRHRRAGGLRGRVRLGLAVLAATVALFPCVSASDDLVTLKQLELRLKAPNELRLTATGKDTNERTFYLARLLETLENFHVSVARSPELVLRTIAYLRQRNPSWAKASLPTFGGRDPPSLISLPA